MRAGDSSADRFVEIFSNRRTELFLKTSTEDERNLLVQGLSEGEVFQKVFLLPRVHLLKPSYFENAEGRAWNPYPRENVYRATSQRHIRRLKGSSHARANP